MVETVEQDNSVAVGEDLEPHESNPLSVQEDVEKAMKEAQEKAAQETEEVEIGLEDETPPDFSKAKEETTPLKDTPQEDAPGEHEPPADWSVEDQGIFRDCPGQVQEWLLARHGAAQAQAAEQISAYEPLRKMQEQWQPYVDQHGIPFDQAVNSVMQAEMVLRTGTPEQKRQTIQHLIQTYGVETGPAQVVPDELQNDPVASALSPQLRQVMEGLNSLKQQVDSRFQSIQQDQEKQQESALEAFGNATDEKGQRLRPYFAEVRPLMEVLASQAQATGRATTIEEVYDQACRASPTVWPKIQAAQQSASLRERRAKAEEKKRAASSVSSSPSSGQNVKDEGKPDESVYDTVQRAFAAHSGPGA